MRWAHGVPEASNAVHPAGNPISHSTHSGFRFPVPPARHFTFCDRSMDRVDVASFLRCPASPAASIAVGVGQDCVSVSLVWSADAASWNHKRPRGVAFAFQVRKHIVERQIEDVSNILSNDPRGPQLLNNSQHLRPEVAVILLASALSGLGEWLAWEPAGNKVNCS